MNSESTINPAVWQSLNDMYLGKDWFSGMKENVYRLGQKRRSYQCGNG